MTTKLTLSMSDQAIKHAKNIARKRGKSLSKMVEEYFISIPEKKQDQVSAMERIEKRLTPFLDRIDLPEDVDYKKMVSDWRFNDYIEKKR